MVPYFHQFSEVQWWRKCTIWCFLTHLHYIWYKFSIIIKNIYAGTVTNLVSYISTMHKKGTIFNASLGPFLVQMRCRSNVHFSWAIALVVPWYCFDNYYWNVLSTCVIFFIFNIIYKNWPLKNILKVKK